VNVSQRYEVSMLVPKADLQAAIGHPEGRLRREGLPASQEQQQRDQMASGQQPGRKPAAGCNRRVVRRHGYFSPSTFAF
jgi:hypothetical protein